MIDVLCGRVQAGKGDAARWLTQFNAAYARKLGAAVYPGSLNLALDQDFNWLDERYAGLIVHFGMHEYGGERDILLIPCALATQAGHKAWLWTTTIGAHNRADRRVVELVCDVGLRQTYGLVDGSVVNVHIGSR